MPVPTVPVDSVPSTLITDDAPFNKNVIEWVVLSLPVTDNPVPLEAARTVLATLSHPEKIFVPTDPMEHEVLLQNAKSTAYDEVAPVRFATPLKVTGWVTADVSVGLPPKNCQLYAMSYPQGLLFWHLSIRKVPCPDCGPILQGLPLHALAPL